MFPDQERNRSVLGLRAIGFFLGFPAGQSVPEFRDLEFPAPRYHVKIEDGDILIAPMDD